MLTRLMASRPAVAIRQKNSTRNPRSTVATATEIYDYLRLLYARIGRTYCLKCGQEVKKDAVDEVAECDPRIGRGNSTPSLVSDPGGTASPGRSQKQGRPHAAKKNLTGYLTVAI